MVKNDFTTRTHEEMVEMGKKAGSVKSMAKTIANNIKTLPQIKDIKKRQQKALQLLHNPELIAMKIESILNVIEAGELTKSDLFKLANLLKDLKTTFHGAINKNMNLTLNLNEIIEQREKDWWNNYIEAWRKRDVKSSNICDKCSGQIINEQQITN